MAISYVTSAVADYTAATTTFSAAVPGTVVAGDLAVIQITTAEATATTFTPPAGSVELVPQSARDASLTQGWYLPLSTAPGSISVSLSSARQGTLAVIFLRGVDTDNPLASDVGFSTPTGSASGSVPAVTAAVDGSYLVGGLYQGSGSASWTPPAGWTIRVDGSRRNGILATRNASISAGSSGVATWTMPSGNASWQAWQVALRPDGPADPPLVAEASFLSEPYPGASGDIADGAAIVPAEAAPGGPFVIVTNKAVGGGLYVLDMAGEILSSVRDGAANSVDWRDLTGIPGWDDRLLVMTVDRDDDLIRYYWMDRTTGELTSAGSTSLGYEPYGSCLYVHSDGGVYAYITDRGTDDFGPHSVFQYPLTRSGSTVSAGGVFRTISSDGVVEGLAADDETGVIFISREDHGLYRYSAAPGGSTSPTTVDVVGGGNLVADVEDVAISRRPDGNFLLVSSQGDNSYHVYDLDTLAHVQRFTAEDGSSNAITGTDGLDMYLGALDGFPDGLIVLHTDSPNPSRFAFIDAGQVFGPLKPTITTANLTSPATRWQGKATRVSWWDGTRWGAVLPTNYGHTIYPDLTDLDQVGRIVDERQDSRVTIVYSDGTLMVLRGHGTSSRFSSYDATNDYAPILTDVSVPLTSTNLDASPITLHQSSNGMLWAATLVGGQVRVTRSSDFGASWATAQTVATVGSTTGVAGFANSGGTVVLLATGNDGEGRAVRSIDQWSGSYASASWTSETLPDLPSGTTSDDHLDIVTLSDGRVFAVSKTTNGDADTWLIYGMVREVDGTWSDHVIVTGGDETTGYTRPNLALEPGAIRLIYGQFVSPTNLYTRTADGGLAWSAQSTLDSTGNRTDSAVAPAGVHIKAATGDYPVLTHDWATGDVDLLWVTPTAAPTPTSTAHLGSLDIVGAYLGASGVAVYVGETQILARA